MLAKVPGNLRQALPCGILIGIFGTDLAGYSFCSTSSARAGDRPKFPANCKHSDTDRFLEPPQMGRPLSLLPSFLNFTYVCSSHLLHAVMPVAIA